jgi:hypothetical protein
LNNLENSTTPITSISVIADKPDQDESKAQQEQTRVAGDLRNARGLVCEPLPSVYHVLKDQGMISCPLIDFKVGD